jgi:hypothetical protein
MPSLGRKTAVKISSLIWTLLYRHNNDRCSHSHSENNIHHFGRFYLYRTSELCSESAGVRSSGSPTYLRTFGNFSPRKYPYSLTHGAEPFLRSCQLRSHSRTSQRFMEPEGSLPRSQEPFTGLYPEPDQSNLYRPILSL